MKLKKGIYLLPNLLTMGNIYCGFFSIISVFNRKISEAALGILAAVAFDIIDGKLARATRTATRFGVEFDSLADLVSFGVAPAVMVYYLVLKPYGRVGWLIAFLFVVGGALRLARFNIKVESSDSRYFTGLPIPGAAGYLASFTLVLQEQMRRVPLKYLVPFMILFLSYLMVSNIRYSSFKEVDFKRPKPFHVLVLFVMGIFIVALHPQVTLLILFSLYLVSGLVGRGYLKVKEIKKLLAPEGKKPLDIF